MSISANIRAVVWRYHPKLYRSDLHLLQCRLIGGQAGAGAGGGADHREGLASGGALGGAPLGQPCLVPTYGGYVCALANGRGCRRVFICVGCADRVSAASQLTNPGGFK